MQVQSAFHAYIDVGRGVDGEEGRQSPPPKSRYVRALRRGSAAAGDTAGYKIGTDEIAVALATARAPKC